MGVNCIKLYCGFVFSVKSSSDKVTSKVLDVIGYFVSKLAMVDINSLAGGSHYSQPCIMPFLPHEEELYNKLVHLHAHFVVTVEASQSNYV